MNRRLFGDAVALAIAVLLGTGMHPWRMALAGFLLGGWVLSRTWAAIVVALNHRAYAEGLQAGLAKGQAGEAREPAEPVGRVVAPGTPPSAPTPRWSW